MQVRVRFWVQEQLPLGGCVYILNRSTYVASSALVAPRMKMLVQGHGVAWPCFELIIVSPAL